MNPLASTCLGPTRLRLSGESVLLCRVCKIFSCFSMSSSNALNHSTLRWPRDMVALLCFLLLGRWGGQQGASCFVGGHSNRSSQIGFHWRIMENRLQKNYFQMMWLVTLVTGSPFVAPEWWKNLPSFPRQFSWQFSVWSQWSIVVPGDSEHHRHQQIRRKNEPAAGPMSCTDDGNWWNQLWSNIEIRYGCFHDVFKTT